MDAGLMDLGCEFDQVGSTLSATDLLLYNPKALVRPERKWRMKCRINRAEGASA